MDRYAELSRAGYLPHCIWPAMLVEKGLPPWHPEVAKLLTCKARYAIRTQKLLPDPEGKIDPETGKVANRTQWVDAVMECKAPWHTGHEPVVDNGAVIEAGRRARALRDGVALTRVEGGQVVKDQCKNGHDMAGTMPNGKPIRHRTERGEVCRMCKAEAAARHKAKRQEKAA